MVLATLGCYPLIKGYSLGNAQTFLSFGFTVLLLLWTTGRERWAGVVAAMLTAVKPQFILLLVWMLVRKRWGAAWAFVACGAVLLIATSVAVFGWHNNLDYIGVLAGLSHKAQSHYANQSMFGTMNRMIFNGENIGYTPYVYTPYIAVGVSGDGGDVAGAGGVGAGVSVEEAAWVDGGHCGDGDCVGRGEPDGVGASLRNRVGDRGVGLVCARVLEEAAAVGVGRGGVSVSELSAVVQLSCRRCAGGMFCSRICISAR